MTTATTFQGPWLFKVPVVPSDDGDAVRGPRCSILVGLNERATLIHKDPFLDILGSLPSLPPSPVAEVSSPHLSDEHMEAGKGLRSSSFGSEITVSSGTVTWL